MLFPKCPRCSNRLPIGAFLIRPKEKRFKIKHVADVPKAQCDKCMAALRTNPKIYPLMATVWIIAGVVLLIGIFIGKITLTGFLILIVILAGCISILLSWRFLEVMDQEKQDK